MIIKKSSYIPFFLYSFKVEARFCTSQMFFKIKEIRTSELKTFYYPSGLMYLYSSGPYFLAHKVSRLQ
jgi:hypothetical protein